jgi:sugar phosphate permease
VPKGATEVQLAAEQRRSPEGSLIAFGVTWLSYASYYLGRKGLSAAKKAMEQSFGPGQRQLLVWIDTAYLLAYALGQAPSGWIGDRAGARRLIGFGMLLSAAACVAFGHAGAAPLFVAAMFVNGLAQSSGWPGNVKAMAEWVPPERRGAVMGVWSTCYQVGGIVATFAASRFLVAYGWRWAFIGPGLCVGAVGLLVLALLRQGPLAATVSANPVIADEQRRQAWRAVVRDARVWSYGACYFFMKLIRYALLFWLPYYFETVLHYPSRKAADFSNSFEIGGVAGTVLLGLLSDRMRRFSRATFAAGSLLALAGALYLYGQVAATSPAANFLAMALVGALLFGPDALITGAAVQDAGGPHAAALTTGLVSALGSTGGLLQSAVTVWVSHTFGWAALFRLFIVFALLAALCLVPGMRLGRASRRD